MTSDLLKASDLNKALKEREDARAWLRQADREIDAMSPGDRLVVAGHYDMVHRIAHLMPSPDSFLRRHYLAAFDAYMSGDKTVDRYLLYRAVSDSLTRRRDRAFLGRPMQWMVRELDSCYRQFCGDSRPADASDYDLLQQLNLLLGSNLLAYEGKNQDQYKRRLVETHRHLLTAPATSSAPLYQAARRQFRLAATRYLPQ